jgi:hypothetical protein
MPEDVLGAEIVPGKGHATPMPDAVEERLIRLWTTWLARGGFFQSDQMHIVEKLTRKGDQILYEVTVEDPEVLAEPWVLTPRVLTLSKFPGAGLISERADCEVYEIKDITSQIRH